MATVCIGEGQYSSKMINHTFIGVSDINASSSFYDAVLQPLSYTRVFEDQFPGGKHQAIRNGVVPHDDILNIK